MFQNSSNAVAVNFINGLRIASTSAIGQLKCVGIISSEGRYTVSIELNNLTAIGFLKLDYLIYDPTRGKLSAHFTPFTLTSADKTLYHKVSSYPTTNFWMLGFDSISLHNLPNDLWSLAIIRVSSDLIQLESSGGIEGRIVALQIGQIPGLMCPCHNFIYGDDCL